MYVVIGWHTITVLATVPISLSLKLLRSILRPGFLLQLKFALASHVKNAAKIGFHLKSNTTIQNIFQVKMLS